MISQSPRHWFPVILAGLTVVLAVFFYATQRQFDGATIGTFLESQEKQEVIQSKVTPTEYQSAVNVILSAYTQDQNAGRAYDALIQLHVPSDMQQAHIDLIVAFGKLAAGNTQDGTARLNAISAQYSWIAL